MGGRGKWDKDSGRPKHKIQILFLIKPLTPHQKLKPGINGKRRIVDKRQHFLEGNINDQAN